MVIQFSFVEKKKKEKKKKEKKKKKKWEINEFNLRKIFELNDLKAYVERTLVYEIWVHLSIYYGFSPAENVSCRVLVEMLVCMTTTLCSSEHPRVLDIRAGKAWWDFDRFPGFVFTGKPVDLTRHGAAGELLAIGGGVTAFYDAGMG